MVSDQLNFDVDLDPRIHVRERWIQIRIRPKIGRKKIYILIILVDLYVSLSRIIRYPDPDPRFLKWIWIRIQPNEVDLGGSGSETLLCIAVKL